MHYHQITPAERYTLATLLKQVPALPIAAIARLMGRHRSTIARELARNSSRHDGSYRYSRAQEMTNGRRSRSRRNSRFCSADWKLVLRLLREDLSPDQISGRLAVEGRLRISRESIYRFIRRDKKRGGQVCRLLRQASNIRKRHAGKLRSRSVAATNRRVIQLIRAHRRLFKTITVDNGTEFHGYRDIERATGTTFYFATPYHSWEHGINENTNGLIRQYLPKRASMKHINQARCDTIALTLNNRPRKRHQYFSPIEILAHSLSI